MRSTWISTSPNSEVRLWCSTVFLVTAQLSCLILRQQREASRQPGRSQLGPGGAADSQMSKRLRRALLLLGKERRPEHLADWPWEQDREDIQKDKVLTLTGLGRRQSRATWKIAQVITGWRGGRKLGPPSLSGLLWEKQDRAGRGSGLANSNYFKGPWSNRHGPLVAWHLALGWGK